MQVLVVDNYDSFVFNLVQYLGQLGVHAQVWRNDDDRLATDADVVEAAGQFDGVLLSPGPGTPERAGASIPLVNACAATKTPLLGVCLGHQAIGVAFGGTVDRAPELLHGKTSTVYHSNAGVLQGLPNPFTATRYHSLTILPDTVPGELEVIAWTGRGVGAPPARSAGGRSDGMDSGGVIMGVRHVDLPIHGVQFHPESILTTQGGAGARIIANVLRLCARHG
jgi:para-aminobenzoate synthetase component 2